MTMTSLSETRFHDEDAAREHIEASRWASGVVCSLRGSLNVIRMPGKTQNGMFLSRDSRNNSTCRTGAVLERSQIPLHKWLLAIHLLACSKKGMSAHQLMRNFDLASYRTAWSLCHRIREPMGDDSHTATGGSGGANKVVDVDDTYVSGKTKDRAFKEPALETAVASLVDCNGRVHSRHVADVTAKAVREVIFNSVNRANSLMTDESTIYPRPEPSSAVTIRSTIWPANTCG